MPGDGNISTNDATSYADRGNANKFSKKERRYKLFRSRAISTPPRNAYPSGAIKKKGIMSTVLSFIAKSGIRSNNSSIFSVMKPKNKEESDSFFGEIVVTSKAIGGEGLGTSETQKQAKIYFDQKDGSTVEDFIERAKEKSPIIKKIVTQNGIDCSKNSMYKDKKLKKIHQFLDPLKPILDDFNKEAPGPLAQEYSAHKESIKKFSKFLNLLADIRAQTLSAVNTECKDQFNKTKIDKIRGTEKEYFSENFSQIFDE